MDTNVESVIRTVEELSMYEQDPPVRAFFDSLSQLSDDPIVQGLIADVLEGRPEITDTHMAYLLYVSLQYVTDFVYDKPVPPETILADISDYKHELAELCRSKNIVTNVVERYLHLQIILEVMDSSVTVVDLGSSVGLGLRNINSDWSGIWVHPQLSPFVAGDAVVERFICVDEQTPDPQWLKACYLPENREYRAWVESAVSAENDPRLEFHQADVVTIPDVIDTPTDVIWTSSMIYQLEYKRGVVETAIKSILKSDGIWVNATTSWTPDNSEYDPDNSYVSIVRLSENWNTPLEVLLSPDDTVSEVRPGSDFAAFKSQVSDRSKSR